MMLATQEQYDLLIRIAWICFIGAGVAAVVGVLIWIVRTGVKEGIKAAKRKED